MHYYLSDGCFLKWLEFPSIYVVKSDELYELDDEAFACFRECSSPGGCFIEGEFSGAFQFALDEGLLSVTSCGERKPLLRKSPAPSLRYLELQLTDRCNLQCRHCYLGVSGGKEINFEATAGLLREFEEMQGLRLLISGGEPLLYTKFDEFNRILPDYAFRKILFTNGIGLTERIIEGLHVDEIQVSIDGLEAGHDFLRGRGSFRKALRAVELSLSAGFDVSVATMVHPGNLKEFGGMESLFRDMGIKEWGVDVPCNEGRLKEDPLLSLSPEVAGPYLRYSYGGEMHEGKSGYGCGAHLAAVTPEGMVAKCGFYRSSPVGALSEGLESCWKKVIPIRLGELDCDCEAIDQCRGGCRYRAGLLGGISAKDPYRCAAMLRE